MPEITAWTALVFGFLLGLKHALDADHVVAVTTIVSRSRNLLHSALVGLYWGIGHTATLFLVGFAVLVLKLNIPDKLAMAMEFVVGIVLVVLGVSLFWQLFKNRTHGHLHQHDGRVHTHSHSHLETSSHEHSHTRRPLLIGMVHGLAGSGVLVPLVLSTMSSVIQGLGFLLLFGAGSILGMLLFSTIIGLPFRFTAVRSLRVNLGVQLLAGGISIAFGFFIMWQIGFVGELFVL